MLSFSVPECEALLGYGHALEQACIVVEFDQKLDEGLALMIDVSNVT